MLRRNVLIFHQAALGDFIVTWPLAVAMGRLFPQSRIIYVTHASKGKLAERVIGVESVDAEIGWHKLFIDDAAVELPESCERVLTAAHTIVSFVSSPNDAWERNVRLAVPDASLIRLATKSEGADSPVGGVADRAITASTTPSTETGSRSDDLPAHFQHHVTAALVRQLKPYPAIQAGVRQIIRSIADRGLSYARTPRPNLIVIHPGAGKPGKCWPTDRFVELAETLTKRGKIVRMLLGETELDRWPPDSIARIESAAEVHRPASYLDLLDEVAAAETFIGNDSGPAHLAGVIGVPTIALFGSLPDRWRPLGPRVAVIHKEPLTSISVSDVLAALRMA